MTLGERLKEFRQRKGISQEQLAENLNVSRQAITKWENDKGTPDIDNLIAISEMLDVTLDVLVRGEIEIVKKIAEKKVKYNLINLVTAIIFFFAAIIWIIVGCINLSNPNIEIAVPILNFCCSLILIASSFIFVKKYFSLKNKVNDVRYLLFLVRISIFKMRKLF